MPRPLLIRSASFAYHVRTRSNNQEWFCLPMERTWRLMCGVMERAIALYRPQIHAFVLMSNHLHLILSTPDKNLDAVMQYFVRESAKGICFEAGRINRIFGGRYQRSLITRDVYFRNAMKYVLRNPVAAGMCARVEEYPFSTLGWTMEKCEALFPLAESSSYLLKLLPQRNELLPWLNTAYSSKQSTLMKRALRRATFRFPTNKNFQKTVREIHEM